LIDRQTGGEKTESLERRNLPPREPLKDGREFSKKESWRRTGQVKKDHLPVERSGMD